MIPPVMRKQIFMAILSALLLWPAVALAGDPPGAAPAPKPLPPLREQAAIRQQWLKLRL